MPTGRGRGRGRGNSGGNSNNSSDDRNKVGVAWINGRNNADQYLDDMLEDGIYLNFRFDPEFEGSVPEGWNVLAFPNKNKQGKAPDFDFVALPPRD